MVVPQRSRAPQSQQQVVERAHHDDQSSLARLVAASNAVPSGSQSADTGGATVAVSLTGKPLGDGSAPTVRTGAAYYTLITEPEWRHRKSAGGAHETITPVEAGSQGGTLLFATRGYKILMPKSEHAFGWATIPKRIAERYNIASDWTSQAARKISSTRSFEKDSQGSSPSRSAAFVTPGNLEGIVPEGLPRSAQKALVPDDEPDAELLIPLAWSQEPPISESAAPVNSTVEDPLELTTVFSEKAWDQVENLELSSAPSSSSKAGTSSADWRDMIQQAVRVTDKQQDRCSASSSIEANAVHPTIMDSTADQPAPTIPEEGAAVEAGPVEEDPVETDTLEANPVGAAPVEDAAIGTATEAAAPVEDAATEGTVIEAAAPEAASSAEVPQSSPLPSTEDPMPWESGRRFQFNLRYLAWMRRADGSPMPVYGENPPSFLQGDYSEF